MTINRSLFFPVVTVFSVCLLISSCGPKRGAKGYYQTPMVDTSHPRAVLVSGSKNLVGHVVTLSPRFRSIGLLTQAEVSIQNLTEDRYTLEYRFEWEDDQGFKVGDSGPWHRMVLTPQQIRSYQSTGKNPNATNIRFTIRYPDDAFIESERQSRQQRERQ